MENATLPYFIASISCLFQSGYTASGWDFQPSQAGFKHSGQSLLALFTSGETR